MNSKGNNPSPQVLVIEDDQSVRRMLRFSLRDAGFEIAEATTGKEALERLEARVPEAVILDLGLPDDLGGAVLDWLRRAERGNNGRPAWVVISAMDLNDLVQQYGSLASHFLAKPFDPWDLVLRLQEFLDNRPP
jgi:CheY-like chemotaxis protein